MGDEDVDSGALALYNRMGRRMEDGEGVHVLSYTVFTSTQGRTDGRTNAECYLLPIDRFSSLCTTHVQWLTIRVHSYSTPVPHLSGT